MNLFNNLLASAKKSLSLSDKDITFSKDIAEQSFSSPPFTTGYKKSLSESVQMHRSNSNIPSPMLLSPDMPTFMLDPTTSHSDMNQNPELILKSNKVLPDDTSGVGLRNSIPHPNSFDISIDKLHQNKEEVAKLISYISACSSSEECYKAIVQLSNIRGLIFFLTPYNLHALIACAKKFGSRDIINDVLNILSMVTDPQVYGSHTDNASPLSSKEEALLRENISIARALQMNQDNLSNLLSENLSTISEAGIRLCLDGISFDDFWIQYYSLQLLIRFESFNSAYMRQELLEHTGCEMFNKLLENTEHGGALRNEALSLISLLLSVDPRISAFLGSDNFFRLIFAIIEKERAFGSELIVSDCLTIIQNMLQTDELELYASFLKVEEVNSIPRIINSISDKVVSIFQELKMQEKEKDIAKEKMLSQLCLSKELSRSLLSCINILEHIAGSQELCFEFSIRDFLLSSINGILTLAFCGDCVETLISLQSLKIIEIFLNLFPKEMLERIIKTRINALQIENSTYRFHFDVFILWELLFYALFEENKDKKSCAMRLYAAIFPSENVTDSSAEFLLEGIDDIFYLRHPQVDNFFPTSNLKCGNLLALCLSYSNNTVNSRRYDADMLFSMILLMRSRMHFVSSEDRLSSEARLASNRLDLTNMHPDSTLGLKLEAACLDQNVNNLGNGVKIGIDFSVVICTLFEGLVEFLNLNNHKTIEIGARFRSILALLVYDHTLFQALFTNSSGDIFNILFCFSTQSQLPVPIQFWCLVLFAKCWCCAFKCLDHPFSTFSNDSVKDGSAVSWIEDLRMRIEVFQKEKYDATCLAQLDELHLDVQSCSEYSEPVQCVISSPQPLLYDLPFVELIETSLMEFTNIVSHSQVMFDDSLSVNNNIDLISYLPLRAKSQAKAIADEEDEPTGVLNFSQNLHFNTEILSDHTQVSELGSGLNKLLSIDVTDSSNKAINRDDLHELSGRQNNEVLEYMTKDHAMRNKDEREEHQLRFLTESLKAAENEIERQISSNNELKNRCSSLEMEVQNLKSELYNKSFCVIESDSNSSNLSVESTMQLPWSDERKAMLFLIGELQFQLNSLRSKIHENSLKHSLDLPKSFSLDNIL